MANDFFGRARPSFTAKEKGALYTQQRGLCKGCGKRFEMGNMAIDHIRAIAKGGGDRFTNLQLLCTRCNSLKGAGTMTQLKAKLKSRGVLKPPAESTAKTKKKPAAKKKA